LGLAVVLVAIIFLLPPIALVGRIFSPGYERISTQAGGYVTAEDGAQVSIPPEGVQARTRIKVTVIPRGSFLEGSAGKSLLKAAETIPPWLIMKSPFYQIQFRGGDPPTQAMIRIPLPADAGSLQTLDLYAWNGEAWVWLPHFIPPGDGTIESELNYLPQSVVLMETKPLQPIVSADLAPATAVPGQAENTIAEINPQGLYLDAEGDIRGDPAALLPDQSLPYAILPTLRNWEAGGMPRGDLIDNMLVDSSLRNRHIQRIVRLVASYGYRGVEIDYRGINPDLQAEFSQFIISLADALHEQGKQLAVVLALPTQIAQDRWDTGAHDWRAIGAVADTIKIPAPADPNAYTPGGQMDAMLEWAVGQVNRYRLELLMSTHSTRQVDGDRQQIPYVEALAPLSQIIQEGGGPTLSPGQTVAFILSAPTPSTGVQFDPASGIYWYAYVDQQGRQQMVWLEHADSIARKLGYVADYHLRGAAVHNLLDERTDGQVWEVMREFINLIVPAVRGRLGVVWQIQGPSGDVVVQGSTNLAGPRYQWTTPAQNGPYRITATIPASPVQVSTAVVVAGPG
jgi:hypothetical protein